MQKQRPVATTTIATMFKVMLGKKLVKRSDGKRGYVWSARVSHARARRATWFARSWTTFSTARPVGWSPTCSRRKGSTAAIAMRSGSCSNRLMPVRLATKGRIHRD